MYKLFLRTKTREEVIEVGNDVTIYLSKEGENNTRGKGVTVRMFEETKPRCRTFDKLEITQNFTHEKLEDKTLAKFSLECMTPKLNHEDVLDACYYSDDESRAEMIRKIAEGMSDQFDSCAPSQEQEKLFEELKALAEKIEMGW